jgi:hypothetical protein
MEKTIKKLPKTLFVTIENSDKENQYFNAATDRDSLVEMNIVTEIGEYELKRRVEVKGSVEELRQIG